MENLHQENAYAFTTYLQPGDSIFCDNIFATYTTLLEFIKILSANVDRDYKALSSKIPPTPYFAEAIGRVSEASELLKEAPEIMTLEVCNEIEDYFSKEYHIEFKPLEHNGEISPLNSYQPLIDNIAKQIGPDFISAGRSRIVKQFQTLFHSKDMQPILKADKIYFPDLIAYCSNSATIARLYDTVPVTALLNAITLQVFERTKRPDKIEAQLKDFKRSVKISVWHPISDDPKISLRFYKNGKLEVQFPNAKSANDFFIAYALASIVEMNGKAGN